TFPTVPRQPRATTIKNNMSWYRPCFLIAVAWFTTPICQGWIPLTTSGSYPQTSTFGLKSPVSCCIPYRHVPLATRERVTQGLILASSGKSRDPEEVESKEGERRPTARMIDTPIPDYLIDMLKEAGEIDENG
ncbi:unnamed protein product, partial [Ascophyllum nodosum]